jgi:hypothetical protein
MHSRLRFTLFAPLAALLACGGSGTTITVPATLSTGDYVITVAGGTAKASTFTGGLTVSGSSVSGVLRYNNPGTLCVVPTQDIPVTGTVANSSLTLTSSAFVNSVATITVPLPLTATTSGQPFSNGTAVISGGTCALASTTAQTTFIPSLAGTFSGTLSSGAITGPATLTITEGTANADGQFPATIAVSFTNVSNSSCNFSIPASSPVSTLIAGTTLQLVNFTGSSYTGTITANDSAPPLSLLIGYQSTGPGTSACFGTYSGTFN